MLLQKHAPNQSSANEKTGMMHQIAIAALT
jgi:hypothetical protein